MELHTFLLRRGTISLMALRSAFTFLNALQAQKRYIEYDDISQGLLLGANLDNMEMIAHNILIYGELLFELLPFSSSKILRVLCNFTTNPFNRVSSCVFSVSRWITKNETSSRLRWRSILSWKHSSCPPAQGFRGYISICGQFHQRLWAISFIDQDHSRPHD